MAIPALNDLAYGHYGLHAVGGGHFRFGKGSVRMRVGIRSVLASAKICTALLLGVVPIASVIPVGDVAFSKSGTGTATEAPLFTAIDLLPRDDSDSYAFGTSGGEQVGYGVGPATGFQTHALLWRGTAASIVDLNPSGFDESEARGVCGGQQVGFGYGPATGDHGHALLWRGSAKSVVDFHPNGFDGSEILGTSGGQQVGAASGTATGGHEHAFLWGGSANSAVDLHPRGFVDSQATGVSGGQQVGYGSAPPTGPYRNEHALLWRGSANSVVDLHPRGFLFSQAYGVSSGQQVGYGVQTAADASRALLWSGSAASVVDLTPSLAMGTNGEEHVGQSGGHAMLWRGSAAGVVDLHSFLPPGFAVSSATSIDSNGDVVGFAQVANREALVNSHAFLWRRNGQKPSTSREQNTTRC